MLQPNSAKLKGDGKNLLWEVSCRKISTTWQINTIIGSSQLSINSFSVTDIPHMQAAKLPLLDLENSYRINPSNWRYFYFIYYFSNKTSRTKIFFVQNLKVTLHQSANSFESASSNSMSIDHISIGSLAFIQLNNNVLDFT